MYIVPSNSDGDLFALRTGLTLGIMFAQEFDLGKGRRVRLRGFCRKFQRLSAENVRNDTENLDLSN